MSELPLSGPTPLPPPNGPEKGLTGAGETLTGQEETVLRVVALDDRPCPVWLLRELAGIDDPALPGVLERLLARGLLAEVAGGVAVGPGTSAGAIVGALSPVVRGLLHSRAAAALAAVTPSAAVPHAAAALDLTGHVAPHLVDTLAQSADAEPDALAELLLAAQATSTDVARRRRWLLAAADNLALAGRGPAALRLLTTEVTADRGDGVHRGHLLGRIAHLYAQEQPSVALACLRGALTQDRLDAAGRATLTAMLGALAARVGHPDADALLRDAGVAHAAGATTSSATHLGLGRAARALARGDVRAARAGLSMLDPVAPTVRREAALIRAERVLVHLGLGCHDDAATAIRQWADDIAAPGPLVTTRLTALDCLRMTAVGELPEAAALAATTLNRQGTVMSDEVRALLVAVVAEVRYRRGEDVAARAVLAAGTGDRSWPDSTVWTPVYCVAAGDPALPGQPRLLATAVADLHRSVRPLLAVPQTGPRLVRAALATGDPDTARRVAALVDTVAVRTPVVLWRGLAAQARGLVDRDPEALRAAVALLRRTAARPALADALLDLAHTAPGRAEARAAAQEAAALYARMGATGDQLTALGRDGARAARKRRNRSSAADLPAPAGLDALSPAEARVAAMLANGATKRETAESLFVSVHTVDSQLRSIYQKLGIHNRLQLVRAWDRRQGVRS
ncbi:helix-turn-helix transcriptional regulator [Plantactinospora sonchi]|uniref:Helix-turn-helix transcriptional regulator n=1 Tax=Plantactinospora sonchi TaxID=1544735 RepID=A0ABU7RRQ4_9ACTN